MCTPAVGGDSLLYSIRSLDYRSLHKQGWDWPLRHWRSQWFISLGLHRLVRITWLRTLAVWYKLRHILKIRFAMLPKRLYQPLTSPNHNRSTENRYIT